MATHRLRSGARSVYTGVGVLFGGLGLMMLGAALSRGRLEPEEILLGVIGGVFLTLGLWSLLGAFRSRVELGSRQLEIVSAFGTALVRYHDVVGLGFFRIPIHGSRWTAKMTKKQHDGGVVVHLWIKTGPKKAKHITASMYDSSRALMGELSTRTERPLEEVPRERFGTWLKRGV